ncbi:MAG: recombination protein NinB [Devosia sp.]
MSDKKTIYLVGPRQKQYAKELIDQAPENYLCEIRKKTRSLEQNSRLWAMLTDISKQVLWYGKHLSPESWKNIFSASLKKQEVVPGLDNDFVVIGQQTSKMSIAEMRDMQGLMSAFGDERDVKWSDNDGIF